MRKHLTPVEDLTLPSPFQLHWLIIISTEKNVAVKHCPNSTFVFYRAGWAMKRFISGEHINEEFEEKQPKSQWAGFPRNISKVWVCLAQSLHMPSAPYGVTIIPKTLKTSIFATQHGEYQFTVVVQIYWYQLIRELKGAGTSSSEFRQPLTVGLAKYSCTGLLLP